MVSLELSQRGGMCVSVKKQKRKSSIKANRKKSRINERDKALPYRRMKIIVRGAVQGVGFRPFVFNLAKRQSLKGWVLNSPSGVQIEVEGLQLELEKFLVKLQHEKPRLAFIQSLEWSYLDILGFKDFRIKKSKEGGEKLTLILPDIATCELCLEEMMDSRNRRHSYPFINCTLCGPRFSIIEKLPYDRPNTSMKTFKLCSKCSSEYHDPEDRRFHAQPTACVECGPRIQLIDVNGAVLSTEDKALVKACDYVKDGKILGLRGLGGFLLVVDAKNDLALKRLRERKLREEKPLALMYPDLDSVKADCVLEPLEVRLLTSPEKPIVLLKKSVNCRISELVAPRNPYLGVMLPYTPLHQLLMNQLRFPIVATSGNLTDEPMAIDTDEALGKLGRIADVFLSHDRPIVNRMDDSITRVIDGREVVLRRARGYAPLPIEVGKKLPKVLALGGHLKNTIAMSLGKQVFVSQHIGDLETKEAIESFQSMAENFQKLYEFKPEIVAIDLHPGYASSRYGESLGIDLNKVQHHLAHVYSVMADNGLEESVLGISWDGTGYGEDDTIWGGEFIIPDDGQLEWVAGFDPFPLIGGEKAIREPRRTALALLYLTFGKEAFEKVNLPSLKAFKDDELDWMKAALEHDIQTPKCRSVGRLFDAISSLLGIRQNISYEGQAAMELEFVANNMPCKPYPFRIKENGIPRYLIDWRETINAVVEDIEEGKERSEISSRFHATLVEAAKRIAENVGERKVALSGGVFQNALMVKLCRNVLSKGGFEVYTHQRIPPNDGGISLGQTIATAEGTR